MEFKLVDKIVKEEQSKKDRLAQERKRVSAEREQLIKDEKAYKELVKKRFKSSSSSSDKALTPEKKKAAELAEKALNKELSDCSAQIDMQKKVLERAEQDLVLAEELLTDWVYSPDEVIAEFDSFTDDIYKKEVTPLLAQLAKAKTAYIEGIKALLEIGVEHQSEKAKVTGILSSKYKERAYTNGIYLEPGEADKVLFDLIDLNDTAYEVKRKFGC